jgi:hypothetical protein
MKNFLARITTNVLSISAILNWDVLTLQRKLKILTCVPSELVAHSMDSLIHQEIVKMEINVLLIIAFQILVAKLHQNLSLKIAEKNSKNVEKTKIVYSESPILVFKSQQEVVFPSLTLNVIRILDF